MSGPFPHPHVKFGKELRGAGGVLDPLIFLQIIPRPRWMFAAWRSARSRLESFSVSIRVRRPRSICAILLNIYKSFIKISIKQVDIFERIRCRGFG